MYGDRLKNVILYGSFARGQADNDSDIDLAVVLQGNVDPMDEIDRMIDLITEINLEHNVLLSVYPVSLDNFNSNKTPILMNIHKEGLTV